MSTSLFLTLLLGCGSGTPADPAAGTDPAEVPTPKPATTPPQPQPATPPTPPKGGPLATIAGNFYPNELPIDDGEEVQVLCGDKLLTGRVSLLPVGEGRVHPTVSVCPQYQMLFRGLSDRMGSGSITLGIGRGPLSDGRPRDFEAGFTKGVFAITDVNDKLGYSVEYRPDGADAQKLFTQENGTGTAGLNWVGDLDDDNVPDFVINAPPSTTEAHIRLWLSAKSKTRQPELVTEFRFTLW